MAMLKRLEEAERDDHRVLSVICGTYVGSDGHFQQQMAPPSEEQQATVLRQVLNKSGLQPWDVNSVETHGTGTNCR